jgi:DNA-binding NtrC family response regulator
MLGTRVSLLVVDDETEIGSILKRYLSVREYDVELAYNGESALKMLESRKFNVVLLDVLMHGLSGEVVAKIIKDKYPQTKLIVITAFADAAWRITREVDLDGCLIKPVVLEDIYSNLQKLKFA